MTNLVTQLRDAHRYGGDKALYNRAANEIERLRAALEHYGRHAHPNCHDLTLNEEGSFGPRNGCLCGFDEACARSANEPIEKP